jgi:prepilin-type N-terminal cleavage/methylation domain-containing protein
MKQLLRGFTVIELVVVITVLGILAGIVLVNMNGWKQRTEASQVQSDLRSAASAMEDYRNNNNGYPTSLPSTFTASNGVTATYTSGSVAGYCINAKSTADPGIAYNIRSTGGAPTPQAGTCS